MSLQILLWKTNLTSILILPFKILRLKITSQSQFNSLFIMMIVSNSQATFDTTNHSTSPNLGFYSTDVLPRSSQNVYLLVCNVTQNSKPQSSFTIILLSFHHSSTHLFFTTIYTALVSEQSVFSSLLILYQCTKILHTYSGQFFIVFTQAGKQYRGSTEVIPKLFLCGFAM